MIAIQAIEMLKLQHRANFLVDPDYMQKDFPWGRAVMVECAELMDHIGWKWWKKQTPDMNQARMELIDIWHFGLSMLLQENKGNVQAAALDIVKGWTVPDNTLYVGTPHGEAVHVPAADIHKHIELLSAAAAAGGLFMIPVFKSLCTALDIDDAQLYTLYVSKNALNDFRQKNGYKDGTYIKMWHGQEDNEVLTTLVDALPHVSYESIYKALELAYTEVTR
jgi:dimeric dUTPase (all-alpha-NTP-PPase superfamily)